MSIKLILIILGLVCFAIKASNRPFGNIDWFALGWLFIVAAVLLT